MTEEKPWEKTNPWTGNFYPKLMKNNYPQFQGLWTPNRKNSKKNMRIYIIVRLLKTINKDYIFKIN